jgi:DNA-binding transcriptional MerR regulator
MMRIHIGAADSLTIGQLAEHTGVSAKTIRYYESIGLLPRPPRGANSYRRYGAADVNRLQLLRRIRLLGVPLSMAKPLLAGASDAQCTEVQHELLALVERRLHAIDQEIAELQRLRSDVEGYQSRLAACRVEPVETSQRFSECSDMSCFALPSESESESEGDHADDCLQQCAL